MRSHIRCIDFVSGIWGLLTPKSPNALTTLDQIFEVALSGGKDRPFLGHRPVVSKNPLKYANHFVWESYGDIDLRRRYLGSALAHLFAKGELGGGEYDTVGIWSANRPGMLFLYVPIA